MKIIEVGNVKARKQGRHEGTLTVGAMPDGAPVELPVIILRGPRDGPVLWLHGCVHGNEYCTTFSIHEFLRSLEPAALRGSVVALPILNLTAFRMHRRSSPFEGFNNTDLNRCFPGNERGGFTERMAHAIYSPLKRYATHFVDSHTAYTSDTRWALYANNNPEVNRVGRAMAEAFGFENTLPTPPGTLVGSAMMSAGDDGIPSFLLEAGGLDDSFSRETVLDVAERLRNVARAIGLLEGEVTKYPPLTTFSNFYWATAPRSGLFKNKVRCGDTITKGQEIGTYYDLFGDARESALAPQSGIVLAINPGPIIPQGDVLVHIGLDPQRS
ncbi:MAG: succinylglutamate desuccinylase/aspartoacylase family protein [Hyphomicrobiales bacterium]|nr:succinylglutamate desuccinylase/aspartoacylase family protein [Hyphomicrobiales bacterium]